MNISTEYICVNHSMQNIMTLSTNSVNPVLLILHGGAGSPDRPLVMKYNSILAEYYNVVCWDQRGSGLSYSNDCLSIDTLLDDLKTVVEYLRNKYKQDKIYIAGHSWGAYLGLRFVNMYPEYVNYYIGTSQGISSLVDEIHKFNFVKNQALKRNESNVLTKLQYFGVPNGYCYPNLDSEAKVFVTKMIHKYGGYIYDKKSFSQLKMVLSYVKCYKFKIFNVFKGMLKSSSILNAEMNCEDKMTPISHLDVPVLLISGENDAICPVAATQDWFDRLEAPEKHFVKVANAAHMVNFEKSEIWNELVIQLLK